MCQLHAAAGAARSAALDTIAVVARYTAVTGATEDDARCFHGRGGAPYSRDGHVHEVTAGDSGQPVTTAPFDDILPLVPGIAERLDAGIRVLDLGCGRGRALLAMAERYPNSTFVGYDPSPEVIAQASAESVLRGLANIRFQVRDLAAFDLDAPPATFDLVTTFDAVHDQPHPGALLRGVRRTLTPGGVYLMKDIHGSRHVHENADLPLGPLLNTVSCMHCMPVSPLEGGEGLGTMWGEDRARTLLEDAGFTDITSTTLPHDIVNVLVVARP